MRFHSILAKVATGLFLVVEMTAASAAVTFNINQTVGAGSVVGQVMTDGAIGTVLAPKVLDWNLIVNDGVTSLNLLGPLSGANSAFGGDSNLSETATQLLFDFSAPAFHFNHFCLGSEATCPGGWAFISFGGGSGVHRVQTNAGLVVGSNLFGLGVIGQLAPVPVPASLWLLGSALSGLGFTRRRGAK